jgi:hypothetical protein
MLLSVTELHGVKAQNIIILIFTAMRNSISFFVLISFKRRARNGDYIKKAGGGGACSVFWGNKHTLRSPSCRWADITIYYKCLYENVNGDAKKFESCIIFMQQSLRCSTFLFNLVKESFLWYINVLHCVLLGVKVFFLTWKRIII